MNRIKKSEKLKPDIYPLGFRRHLLIHEQINDIVISYGRRLNNKLKYNLIFNRTTEELSSILTFFQNTSWDDIEVLLDELHAFEN